MPNFILESILQDKGYSHVVGIDEAGRGPLASSVFAGAVILDQDLIDTFSKYLNDSKKLSKKKRKEYCDLIKASCEWAIGEATHEEIDELNILNATKLAMYRAWSQLKQVDYLLIDGNMSFDIELPYKSIVKGDATCLSIAAASIIAKEAQCERMLELDIKYPEYAFKKHFGYGTKVHCATIEKYGPSPVHRKTFKRVREFVKWEG